MFVKHVINQAVSINEDLELLCAMVFHNPNVRSCFLNVINSVFKMNSRRLKTEAESKRV